MRLEDTQRCPPLPSSQPRAGTSGSEWALSRVGCPLIRVTDLALSDVLAEPTAGADGGPPCTILIIDDDAVVRVIVRRHLEADGYRVLEAGDGQSGLDLIETHVGPLDLVLTDIDMPQIDGVTVVEVLTALRPLLGVVCMSAGMAESRFVERLALRPQPFLAKPFTRRTLAAAMSLELELARSRELAHRLQAGNTSPDGAGEQPLVLAMGLVAAARRLQQGWVRHAAATKSIDQASHADGPLS